MALLDKDTDTVKDPTPEEMEADEGPFPEDYEDYYPLGMLEDLRSDRNFQIESKREDIRGRLALIYTLATFGIFVLGFLVAVGDAILTGTSMVDNLVEILPLISGIFLGSLGFVLGYYFRRAEGEDGDAN